MRKAELGKRIANVATITGDFVLHSGETTGIYFDKYRFESDPILLLSIVAYIDDLLLPILIGKKEIDFIAGLEMGGIPIVTALSIRTYIPALFVRKETKVYGTCNLVEGANVEGKRLIIIEDVVTSGRAVVDAVNNLRELGAIVEYVCCVIDRESTGRETLEAMGLDFRALFTKSELESYARAH